MKIINSVLRKFLNSNSFNNIIKNLIEYKNNIFPLFSGLIIETNDLIATDVSIHYHLRTDSKRVSKAAKTELLEFYTQHNLQTSKV